MVWPHRGYSEPLISSVCVANRGKISLAGVIMRKYLHVNCLLVTEVYKTDNDMNLNGVDRGTAQC